MPADFVRTPAPRRTFLRHAAVAAAVPAAAALTGLDLASPARADTLPDFAPVPPSSLGPALNAAGYYVAPIADALHWVTDGSYQAMFLTTREGVMLVDAPPTLGHNLQRAIDDVTRPAGLPNRVTHLIHSHSHADHIGASGLFGGAERIGHAENRWLLRRAADPLRPAPDTVFEDHLVVEVGGERLELHYHGPNHAPDNIFVRAPRQRTLMVVDVVYPGWVPFTRLAVSQDVPGWIRAHDVALGYRWNTLVGGHLGRLGTRADAELQRQYVGDLRDSAKSALEGVDPTPFFAKYGPTGNSWAVFRTYLEAVAERAAGPVTAKYLGRLAAADVFTVDNAAAMLESLRIDSDVLGPFGVHA
ncbi:MBL fold metallo-hydrolase [Streptacidiphilus anmyonensis]|uniref:MBL fold metallo-hydrolase n=1 Tax=Streptacidiphilus anmyonensis TaxID=405782 RepID=UPI000A3EB1BE|nr:MBL fold metallo-hydrolase [Streptacidiphilus anmyonensis]